MSDHIIKCQNFLRVRHLVIFGANQSKKPPCMYVHIVIKKIIIVLESRRRETTFPEQVLVGDTFSNNPRLRQNKNHQNKFPNTPRAVCRRLLTLFYPIFISWTKMSHFRWKTFILKFICLLLNICQSIFASYYVMLVVIFPQLNILLHCFLVQEPHCATLSRLKAVV